MAQPLRQTDPRHPDQVAPVDAAMPPRRSADAAAATAAGERLAHVHRTAPRAGTLPDGRARVDRDADAAMASPAGIAAPQEVWALRRCALAFQTGWADVLAARLAAGLVIRVPDPHDVADALALLVVGLAVEHGSPVGDAATTGYARVAPQAPPAALVAHYALCRLLRRMAQAPSSAVVTPRLLPLAHMYAWRSRGTVALLLTGTDARARASLAAALGAHASLPVLSCADPGRVPRAGTCIVDTGLTPARLPPYLRRLTTRSDRPALVVVCRTAGDASPWAAGEPAGLGVAGTATPGDVQHVETWLDHRLATGDR